jgi:hypothetical protein
MHNLVEALNPFEFWRQVCAIGIVKRKCVFARVTVQEVGRPSLKLGGDYVFRHLAHEAPRALLVRPRAADVNYKKYDAPKDGRQYNVKMTIWFSHR